MAWANYVAAHSPEVYLFLAVAIGTVLGRRRIGGFSLGTPACILLVAVALGQLGTIALPAVLKSILFGLFVFTVGFRSGPEFFASLSLKTLSQVVLALVIGACGLAVILVFAYTLHLGPGTAAGVGAGSLTQTSMMGTATGALEQLGLSAESLKREQADIAAGYAVTYICGYILVLLFVPFGAPRLMGVSLKDEAAKLEADLMRGVVAKPDNLLYRKFQARVYKVSQGAGRTVGAIELEVGRRAVVERILRRGQDVEPRANAQLEADDEILLAGPSGVIVRAASTIGPEIEGEHVIRPVRGQEIDVLMTARDLHGLTLSEIVNRIGDAARGVFLRALTRRGQEVPVSPGTQVYIGDVLTLVAVNEEDMDRLIPRIGEPFRSWERVDVAFLAGGLAVGLLAGLLTLTIGSVPLTLGGGGGALVAGLVCGWFHARRPTIGAFPPAAQQALSDLGLGGFIAAIGLSSGPAALAAVQAHGLLLLGVGLVVTLTPMVIGTLVAHRVLHMNPVIICGALAGAMTVDAAVAGACEVADSKTPILGVAVPYAIANVVLTVLGPIIVSLTFAG